MVNDNRVVRLPLYDPETGDDLPGYLEVDVTFFLSATRGLRSTQARLVELDDTEYPDPTPEQEIDMIDRIISGLPARAVTPKVTLPKIKDEPGTFANISERKIFDVASLHPQEVVIMDVVSAYPKLEWKRIPEFENYEINQLGEVRNRFTKRILETATEGNDGDYVEMHDKDGFPHYVSVESKIKVVFGE